MTCQDCGGQGGHAETTINDNGGAVTVFRPCSTCNGRGTR